jgi:DNA-binding transcriptional ArsR family regulator
METLPLYTGHAEEIAICINVLGDGNRRIVVEGKRGVGTTSFSNYVRFSLQEKKIFFTPRNEIRVEPGWQIETLLAVIIANIIREAELFASDKVIKDKRFLNAKAVSARIAETYRSFGVDAFSIGFNYGKSAGVVTQPILVPAAVLGHHIEDLIYLIKSAGYQKGILIQLNNLDVGEIHEEGHLKTLFNALRDYSQTDGISWLFVGDLGLRKFIAQQVDRLDDIISFEVVIGSLKKEEFEQLILKRVNFYRSNTKVELPIDVDVFLYLFDITKGRLRYIFGLLARLMASLHIGDLTDRVTLLIAKSMLIKLARVRIQRNDITPAEEQILRIVVQKNECIITEVSKELGKSSQYVGKILNKLLDTKLVKARKYGKKKYYSPSLDAIIAYTQHE